jgi:hypothetical protein
MLGQSNKRNAKFIKTLAARTKHRVTCCCQGYIVLVVRGCQRPSDTRKWNTYRKLWHSWAVQQRYVTRKGISGIWPPQWSSDQRSWLQIQRSYVWSPVLPDFLRSSGSRTGSTQQCTDNRRATWKKSSDCGIQNRDKRPEGAVELTTRHYLTN